MSENADPALGDLAHDSQEEARRSSDDEQPKQHTLIG